MRGNVTARSPQDIAESQPVRIAIVGSGYIGLVVAACFAEMGHTVISVDTDTTSPSSSRTDRFVLFCRV